MDKESLLSRFAILLFVFLATKKGYNIIYTDEQGEVTSSWEGLKWAIALTLITVVIMVLHAALYFLLDASKRTLPVVADVTKTAIDRAILSKRTPDEPFYELVLLELSKNDIKSGLWAKVYAETEGDKQKAKARYIQIRAEQLKKEYVEKQA